MNYFETLPKTIIVKIAEYLKIGDRANMARCSKKLSVAAPGIAEMRPVFVDLLEKTKLLQKKIGMRFCRICCDYLFGFLNKCSDCAHKMCIGCSLPENDEFSCTFCSNRVYCSICDDLTIAKCLKCARIICLKHSHKNNIWRGEIYECSDCFC